MMEFNIPYPECIRLGFKEFIMSKKQKFKDIINSDTPVLVDFYATWCGPCKALSPVIGEVKKELGKSMRVIKVDVDKKQSISNKYKVKSLPTLAIFQNGKILWRDTGVKTKSELLRIANHYIENTGQATSGASTVAAKKTSWLGRLFSN